MSTWQEQERRWEFTKREQRLDEAVRAAVREYMRELRCQSHVETERKAGEARAKKAREAWDRGCLEREKEIAEVHSWNRAHEAGAWSWRVFAAADNEETCSA